MTSHTTRAFRKALKSLPSDVQVRAQEAFRRFKADPDHPSLRLKQIHLSFPIYSARVGRGPRALAVRDGEAGVWFWFGPHSDYDNLLRRL